MRLRAFPLLLLPLLPITASAELAIIESHNDGEGRRFVLRYDPRPVAISRALALPADVEDDLQLYRDAAAAAPPLVVNSESILLPVPDASEDSLAQWKVIEDGDSTVSLAPVVAGGKPALRVTANGTGTSTMTITGPAREASGAQMAKTTALPAPPASLKFVFHEDERGRVLTLPESEFSTAPALFHHAQLIATGGSHNGRRWFFVPRALSTAEFDAVFVEKNPASPPPSVSTRPAFTALTPQGTEVSLTRSRLYDDNLFYERAAPLPIGERFVQHRIVTGESKTVDLAIEDLLTTETITLSIHLVSVNTENRAPEHYARLSIDDKADWLDVGWGGRGSFQVDLTFPFTARPIGKTAAATGRVVQFHHEVVNLPGSVANSIQDLESVRVTWQGKPRLDSRGICELAVPAGDSPRRVTIGGFANNTLDSDVLLLDITDPLRPVQLTSPALFTDESGSRAIEFEAPATASVFYAQSFATLPAPAPLVSAKSLPQPPAAALRGIYVCPAPLADALQPLLTHRGAGFVRLDPEAAYDACSNGQESPEAIREALSAIVAAAQNKVTLPSVVLVGHATFDPHNYLGLKNAPQVPTFVEQSVDTGFNIESCVDFNYGLLAGNDRFQDAMVGRLPAKSAAELTVMVNRIIAHDRISSRLAARPRPAVFVTDNDFAPATPEQDPWPSYWTPTGRPYRQVIGTSNGPADFASIRAGLEESPDGPALVYFFGHGNYNRWGGTPTMLATFNVPSLNTENKWPFVVTFTCFNTYYANPTLAERCLGEAWLLQENGRGTTANIAPCTVDYYDGTVLYSEVAMNQFKLPPGERPRTVGEFITRARNDFELAYPELTLSNSVFLLMGDPMTSLTLDGQVLGNVWLVQ